MLDVMSKQESNQHQRDDRGYTGPSSGPDLHARGAERFRALLAAEDFFITAAAELAAETQSPTEAAALALVIERAHRQTSYLQVLAAQAAQRTLAHELPLAILEVLSDALARPEDFLATDARLPEDPVTHPSGRLPHKNTTEFLQHLLGCGYFESRDRVRAGTAMLTHTDVNGIQHPARYPRLSADAKAGTIDPKQAIQVAKKLDAAAPEIQSRPDAASLATTIEKQALDSLHTQGPAATNKLIASWRASLEDTASSEPSDEEIASKTGIFLTRRTEHFSYFSLCMLNIEAEVLLSHFANADNPRTAAGNREKLAQDATSPDFSVEPSNDDEKPVAANMDADADAPRLPAWAADPETPKDQLPRSTYNDVGLAAAHVNRPQGGRDTTPPDLSSFNFLDNDPGQDGLSPARRRLQTILNVLRSVKGTKQKESGALAKATLVVNCQLETLLGLAERAGISAHGLSISPGELRRMLCDSGVLPVVFSGQSQILDIGREQRFVPEYMRQAILARDGGCLVPGCTESPEHCQMCHIVAWEDGGSTSVTNTGPGCSAHHHDFHSGKIRLVLDDNGLPAVILPKYMDSEQLPRRNAHWQHENQTNPRLF
jgi:hypothetical protein